MSEDRGGTRAPRRRYSDEERARVLADVARLGVCGAARAHGVPQSCVSRWRLRQDAAEASAVAQASPTAAAGAAEEARAGQPAAEQPAVEQPAAEQPAVEPSAAEVAAEANAEAEPAAEPKTKGVAHRYTPSEKARALEYAAAHGVRAASRALGISRFSLYEWQRQVQRAAEGQGPSPTSGPEPKEVEAQRDREILAEWRKHPGLGPSQIRNQLRRRGIKVSTNTVRHVMEDAGYRPPKVRRQPHDERFEAVRPNHIWHLDYLHRHINRAPTFSLIILDDHSRFVVGHGTDDAERADLVIRTFEQAVARHGKPEMVLHDKGAAFWSWRGISRFTALLTELGIDQIAAEHKEWNGKLEVFNANLAKELFDVHRFYDTAEMRRRLASHLHWYNHARTNHALGGLLVPADRYYGRVEEVLARIEAGGGRELGDGLELRDRRLELFKVSSRDGVTEVWLMGQRLLEMRG